MGVFVATKKPITLWLPFNQRPWLRAFRSKNIILVLTRVLHPQTHANIILRISDTRIRASRIQKIFSIIVYTRISPYLENKDSYSSAGALNL